MPKSFRVIMTPGQELISDPLSTASGLGTVIFDEATIAASYAIRVANLDFGPALGQPAQTPGEADDVEGIHVHNAPRGSNGPIVFGQIGPAQDNDDLSILRNSDGSWIVRGVWETTDPANVSLTSFTGQLVATPIGSDVSLYFNIHTHAAPAGIIRGQWVALSDDASNVISGTSGGDLLPGLGGNDRISGGPGADTIFGGTANDRISGRSGNDQIFGEDGRDRVDGNSGNDVLSGGNGGDRMSGGGGNDHMTGGNGNDRMEGNSGKDRLSGDSGRDSLSGGAGNDVLSGGANRDRLNGGAGNDSLSGGTGNDHLNGSFGSDVMRGGSGNDIFAFNTGLDGSIDTIRDFNPAQDTLHLSQFTFAGLPLGLLSPTAFHVGVSADDPAERIVYDIATGALSYDPDGSGAGLAIQFARLSNLPALTNADLIIV